MSRKTFASLVMMHFNLLTEVEWRNAQGIHATEVGQGDSGFPILYRRRLLYPTLSTASSSSSLYYFFLCGF
jgi:hypothetical protein